MTKIDGRTKELAKKQLDESLKRLKVDHIDLMQHHEIIQFDAPDRIFAEPNRFVTIAIQMWKFSSGLIFPLITDKL